MISARKSFFKIHETDTSVRSRNEELHTMKRILFEGKLHIENNKKIERIQSESIVNVHKKGIKC